MTLRRTIYFTDFNNPKRIEFDDDEDRVGPSPEVGDVVTLADFSKEFYCDCKVIERSEAKKYYPKCKESSRNDPLVVLEEIKREEQIRLNLREYDNGLLYFPHIYYDEDPDYEEPPDTEWMNRNSSRR